MRQFVCTNRTVSAWKMRVSVAWPTGHRSAPDGSRFHYLHVSPACAPQLAAWLSKPRLIEPNELSCSTTILAYTKGCTSFHAEPAATGTLNPRARIVPRLCGRSRDKTFRTPANVPRLRRRGHRMNHKHPPMTLGSMGELGIRWVHENSAHMFGASRRVEHDDGATEI